VVEETERNLRMLDSVIRYLSVKVDENIDITARPSEIDDASYEKAAQTAADEEDLFLSRGAEEPSALGDDDDEYISDEFDNEIPSGPGPAKVEKVEKAEKAEKVEE
jgi:small subunit ribosomal protein S6